MSAGRVALAGVFVGGRSTRMGGRPKGLLRAPGETRTLVERTRDLAREVARDVVLVGDADAYAGLGIPAIVDARRGAGPLGGLVALLERAGAGAEGAGADVLALSCDLPFLDVALLRRLVAHAPGAPAVAALADGVLQPLVARYAARLAPMARASLEAGRLSLQRVLEDAGAVAIALDAVEGAAVEDWDSPADVARRSGRPDRP